MRKLLWVLVFPVSGAFAQDSAIIRRMADDILTNGQAYNNLRILCKQAPARLSGSANAAKAVALTEAMLREAGADTVYLQPCMVPHWERGAKEEAYAVTGNGRVSLAVCALGNSVGTPATGLTASVVEVRSFDELDKLGKKGLSGRIVFLNYPMNQTLVNTFSAYSDAVRYRVMGPSAAAKYGAVGFILRTLSTSLNDFPHTGTTRYDSTMPKIPAFAVSTNDAERLHVLVAKGAVKSIFMKASCRMLPDAPSYNVIGEIRGSEHPDEVVTVGGHLDSWDLAEGAQDDGAGIVQSIEVIRALKAQGIRPARTVRAVMFMNEENGGRGGKAYSDNAVADGLQYIFGLESDNGGFTPRGFSIGAKGAQLKAFTDWAPLFEPYGVYEWRVGGGGADVDPLVRAKAVVGELLPDSQRYFDFHHAGNDVFEAVNRRELLLGAVNMTALIYLVSKYGI
ncbi:M20/M25/M40 family metallo-hydrolase [Dinghuibacter silviterrae]|uniref:Carboxypeptidase Q n=1 Tax=Dinghuibacter silviterrae TaxID=1539049 RepID=A0A4R8DNF6_9BACT|nr:M20/M25/M40 family metallo-hydrolase [Dinghuibacter silviterrae]TDW99338.1 peptidase M28-like protein [Dinghuibacter silviterrae]